MNRRTLIIAAAAAAVIIAAFGLNWYITYKKPNTVQEGVILIYRDATYQAVEDSIKASGTIKNLKSLERAARKRDLASHFEPGRYVIEPGMSNQYIIRMIANGWQTPAKVTLRGYIKTLDRLAAFLGRNFEADSAAFATALKDTAMIDSLGFRPETFIGMFIPNTYEFYWTSSPESVIKRFKKEYDTFWSGRRDRLAKEIGLDRNEVMTLASIVIGETNNAGEMPKIAGVYMNRLHRGMRLQACPTVIYLQHLQNKRAATGTDCDTHSDSHRRGAELREIQLPVFLCKARVRRNPQLRFYLQSAQGQLKGLQQGVPREREASRKASNAA